MAFRSHVMRSLDMSRPSNLLIVGLVVVAAVSAAFVVWTYGESEVLLAPVYTFVSWALVREIDPDHEASAIIAAFAAGSWVVAGLDASGLAFTAGLVVATRLVVNSTGRRPLPTDLGGVVVIAAALSFSAIGWVSGFAIAIAIYVDDRMADWQKAMSVAAAAAAASAASVIATLASVFPERTPAVIPELVAAIGLLGLIAFAREPETPASLVDSRRKTPMMAGRLHAARGLAGVATFAAVILAGQAGAALAPAGIALALSLASNELERIRRRAR